MNHNQTPTPDVVVVGSGIAGLSAAVAAAQSGARVTVLERSNEEDQGGQTRWTEAQMRMKSELEVSDDFEQHFSENAGHYLDPSLINEVATGPFESWSPIVKSLGFTDPEIISTLTEKAGPTIQWLKGFGARFDFIPSYFITTCTTRMSPVGGGLALINSLLSEVEKLDITVLFNTTARELVCDDHGAVTGVVAYGPGNQKQELKAQSVVLASGGFQGNPEMLVHYLGPQARYIRPVARGGYYNKGEGIRMALNIGAAPSGDFSQIHAEPLDPRSGGTEPIMLVFNYGIMVNTHGNRFIDEAPTTVDATYEAITRVIMQQPEGLAWIILDSKIDDVPNWRRSIRTDQPPVTADSIGQLAQKINVPAATLLKTVNDYNAACQSGNFDPLAPDDLSTIETLTPPKSNWARPLDTGPFLAYPVICGNCFTFGGIRTNTHAQVINTDGDVIPGLYAAGEMTGIYYGVYTGATSVLRGAVYGKIAGEHAAKNRTNRAGDNTSGVIESEGAL